MVWYDIECRRAFCLCDLNEIRFVVVVFVVRVSNKIKIKFTFIKIKRIDEMVRLRIAEDSLLFCNTFRKFKLRNFFSSNVRIRSSWFTFFFFFADGLLQ